MQKKNGINKSWQQGLIFVKEPYFNEPGFEKYQGTERGEGNSKRYNLQIEHATLTYAIREQVRNGPPYFKASFLKLKIKYWTMDKKQF